MNTSLTPCNLVSPQGFSDIHQLAQTFKNNFPALFNASYSPEYYSFTHTSAFRTEQSCEAFAETLFSQPFVDESKQYWTTNDTMLRVS